MEVQRKILLNPGPATTTDTVKFAQVVPDICPREKEFVSLMDSIRKDLVRIVHGSSAYTAVLFCGSGTLGMDVCLNSLLPADGRILIIQNGAYSARAVEICRYYGLAHISLEFPVDGLPSLEQIEKTLRENKDISVVYATHHETGTGILNPIREIGALAHRYQAVFIVDTTSTYAMRPFALEQENVDFCMASAQKGLMAMTGVSFVIGRRDIIEKSFSYPKRSYYCNLYMQYKYFETHGEMHFTPPVQTLYAMRQALTEYFQEGEQNKWERHARICRALRDGASGLGFREIIKREWQSGLVVALKYPDDHCWDFEAVHDYCYERGYTIYPGKTEQEKTFRLCAFGALDEQDIRDFFRVLEDGLRKLHIAIPVLYRE